MKLILDKEEDEYESYYYDYDADGEHRSVLFRIHNPLFIRGNLKNDEAFPL